MRPVIRTMTLAACIVSVGCAATPEARAPGRIDSAVISEALTHPREDKDAPLLVHDIGGEPYVLGFDEHVFGPTPPDGVPRETSVRVLAEGCESAQGRVPGAGPCWLLQHFTVVPRPPPAPAAAPPSYELKRSLAGFLIVSGVSATVICAVKCAEPWNVAVPVGVGAVVLTTLVVGAFVWSSAVATTVR
jgi:hypothetical protein